MKVTAVRLTLADQRDMEHGLLAYASIELDECLVIQDVKLLNKSPRRGDGLFLSMPCKELTIRCSGCGQRVPTRLRNCGRCNRVMPYRVGVAHYADQCHPITPECRRMLEQAVIGEWRKQTGADQAAHRDEIPVEVFGGGTDA